MLVEFLSPRHLKSLSSEPGLSGRRTEQADSWILEGEMSREQAGIARNQTRARPCQGQSQKQHGRVWDFFSGCNKQPVESLRAEDAGTMKRFVAQLKLREYASVFSAVAGTGRTKAGGTRRLFGRKDPLTARVEGAGTG